MSVNDTRWRSAISGSPNERTLHPQLDRPTYAPASRIVAFSLRFFPGTTYYFQ